MAEGQEFSSNVVKIHAHIDNGNSTNIPLGVDEVFTGKTRFGISDGICFITIATDTTSAVDGLSIEQSSDGTNWDHCDVYSIPASASKNYSINPHSAYFRVVYTNGTAAQTYFRLQTIHKGISKASSHRIKDEIIGDDDCVLVKAALTGENGDGDWHNVKTTPDGYLAVSNNSDGLAIAEGNVTGKTFVHKFGEAPDFDQADGEVTLWDGANDILFSGSPPMSYTFSSSSDIGLISSSDNSDIQDIEIEGLDSNFNLVNQIITLDGTTDVDISGVGGTDLIRVFRMINIGNTDISGVIYIRTNGSAQTAGVPDTANTVRAIINNGNNQTLMALYTVPNNKTGYMRSWYAATAGASRSSEYKIKIKARPFGGVFQLKHSSAISDTGTSKDNHPYVEPEVFPAKTDIIMTVEMLLNAATQAEISCGFDIVLVDD